jgi:hypothetical protein
MTNFPKWQDVRDGIVGGAGGEEAVTGAHGTATRPTSTATGSPSGARHSA